MASHNQNGGRGSLAGDSGSSWRPRDPSSQAPRGRDAEDDRGDDRAWRDRSFRDERPAREWEPRCRDSVLTGRNDMVPSPGSFEERHRDDRCRDLGTDDRFTGRGRPSYGQDRVGYDLDRYDGQSGRDFESERRRLSRAGYGHGYTERMGYTAGSYGRDPTGYGGPASEDVPPRRAAPEPHVHRGTGPHRGKGPSGYQRSDERIREMVCESLADDDQIDATHIEVAVSHGEVTLSGTVEDRRTKRDAEDCAWCVSGVRDVQNMLRVDDRSTRGDPPSNPSGQAPVGRNETEVPVQDPKHRA